MQELPKEFIDKYIETTKKLNAEQLNKLMELIDKELKITYPST